MSEVESGQPLETAVARKDKGLSEDWTAVIVGVIGLVVALSISLWSVPEGLNWESAWPDTGGETYKWDAFTKAWLSKPGTWDDNPAESLLKTVGESEDGEKLKSWLPIAYSGLGLLAIGSLATVLRRRNLFSFLAGFVPLFLLALLAYILAGQVQIKHLNLEYALWALLLGLIICNTVGLPGWLKPAVNGELYIKIGLVLMGAEVLMGRLLELGLPGIFVAWIVTPIVLISTYIFGQKVLKMESRSLNMVISADMSVCGVSAAIATAAACKAKREELSLAVGLSLSFTVLMMILMPPLIAWMGLDPLVGGAWLGGTIDATGAVAAAGEMLYPNSEEAGQVASEAAVTIKMIQNILIGVTAFAVAIYWTTVVEGKSRSESQVGVGEIWKRFPKFVLGFVLISIVASLLASGSYFGSQWVNATVGGVTKNFRGWLFCLAFVCIGLETNFRQLLPYFRTGKPAVLYVVGQSLNLLLTLLMAQIMFGWLNQFFEG